MDGDAMHLGGNEAVAASRRDRTEPAGRDAGHEDEAPEPSLWRHRLLDVRLPPPRLAAATLVAVVLVYGVLAVVGVAFQAGDATEAAVWSVCVVGLVALQLGYVSRPHTLPRAPVSWAVFAMQAVLVFVPIARDGPVSLGLPGLLAGSALLLFPASAGVPLFVLVVLALDLVGLVRTPFTELASSALNLAYITTSAVTAGIAVFGLTTLVRLVMQAHDRREGLRQAAIWRERLRFTRDLQEIVGRTLSSIALDGALVMRLLRESPEQASRRLRRVLTEARDAKADVRAVASSIRSYPDDMPPSPPGAPSTLAPRFAILALGVVIADFLIIATLAVTEDGGAVTGACAALASVVLLALLLRLCGPSRPTGAGSLRLLAAAAVLAYGPTPWFGPQWHVVPALVAAAALATLPLRTGLAVFGATWAAAVVLDFLTPPPNGPLGFTLFYIAVGFPLVTLIVIGIGLVAQLARGVDEARDELGRIAVAVERVRMARDVHDVLGFSLSTIMVKIELAERLAQEDTAAAAGHLRDALDTTQAALAEVGAVVEDRRETRVDDELGKVSSTLRAAGIDVRVMRRGDRTGCSASSVLAVVLRESATNVLRHSDARCCRIALVENTDADVVTLVVVNDGLDGTTTTDVPHSGRGIGNLSTRLHAAGGHLETRATSTHYLLRARLPLSGPARGEEATDAQSQSASRAMRTASMRLRASSLPTAPLR